jgi:hypothetical protein
MEAAFTPGKKPSTHKIGQGVGCRSHSGGFREKSPLLAGTRTQDHPNCSPITIPTVLYRHSLASLHLIEVRACFRSYTMKFRNHVLERCLDLRKVCWDVTPYCLVSVHRPFEWICSSIIKMHDYYSETSVLHGVTFQQAVIFKILVICTLALQHHRRH